MSLPDPENMRTAADYWQVLVRVIPVALFGGITAMTLNLFKIAREKTWLHRILMIIAVSSTGALSAVIGVLGISLFLPGTSPEVDIVIAGVCGSLGQRTFDIYGRRIFNLQTRTTDKEQIEREQNSGTRE